MANDQYQASRETAERLLQGLGLAHPALEPRMHEKSACTHACKIVIDEVQAPVDDSQAYERWCMKFDYELPKVVPVVLTFDSRAIHVTLDMGPPSRNHTASLRWSVMRNRGAHTIGEAGLVIMSLVIPFRIGLPPDPVSGYLNSGCPPLERVPEDD